MIQAIASDEHEAHELVAANPLQEDQPCGLLVSFFAGPEDAEDALLRRLRLIGNLHVLRLDRRG